MKQITDAFGRRLEKKGITRIQWIALYYLGKNENLNQNDLANLMNIKGSTVARLIDRMERDGLVIRKKDSKDRRVTILIISKNGLEINEDLMAEGTLFSDEIMDGISEEELIVFNNVMSKMLENSKKIE